MTHVSEAFPIINHFLTACKFCCTQRNLCLTPYRSMNLWKKFLVRGPREEPTFIMLLSVHGAKVTHNDLH